MPTHLRPDSSAPALATSQVVFALSAAELGMFFPGELSRHCPGARWVDIAQHDVSSWNDFLSQARPQAIVSGWSTPRIADTHAAVLGGSVQLVCHVGGSVRHIVSRAMIAAGLPVVNWGPIVAPLVAEHTILLMLAGLRNLGAWHDFVRRPAAEQHKHLLRTRSLRGKRVGLYGFGAIARALVAQLQPFGTEISAYSRGVPSSLFGEHGVSEAPSLEALARGSDVFVCCEALTPATRATVDEHVIAALPDGAVFVNVARGALVVEAPLAAAARNRGIRVASDVFNSEPLPPDSPFFALPGVIVSPHIAGPTHDTYPACGAAALRNLERYARGEPLESVVTVEVFDRST